MNSLWATILVLGFLCCAPFFVLCVEFGFRSAHGNAHRFGLTRNPSYQGNRDGLRLARLYSHLFIWPFFGIIALGYSYSPISFLVAYLNHLNDGHLRLALLAGVPALGAFGLVIVDQLGSPALWEIKPDVYRIRTEDICGPGTSIAPADLVNALFVDLDQIEREQDSLTLRATAADEAVDRLDVYSVFVRQPVSARDETEYRAALSNYLQLSKIKDGPSATRCVSVLALWAMSFSIFYGLCVLCVYGLQGDALHGWNKEGFGKQVTNLFIMLTMVGLWLLKRWQFQRESAIILNTNVSRGYSAIRNAYTYVLAAYLFASGLLVLALKSESETALGNLIFPLLGASVSATALLRPRLVERFVRALFGVGSDATSYGVSAIAIGMIWALPLAMELLTNQHGFITWIGGVLNTSGGLSTDWILGGVGVLVLFITSAPVVALWSRFGLRDMLRFSRMYNHFFVYPLSGGLLTLLGMMMAIRVELLDFRTPPFTWLFLTVAAAFSSFLLLPIELSGATAPWELRPTTYRAKDSVDRNSIAEDTTLIFSRRRSSYGDIPADYLERLSRAKSSDGRDPLIALTYVASFIAQTFMALFGVEIIAVFAGTNISSSSVFHRVWLMNWLLCMLVGFATWLKMRGRFQADTKEVFAVSSGSDYAVLRRSLEIAVVVWLSCLLDTFTLAWPSMRAHAIMPIVNVLTAIGATTLLLLFPRSKPSAMMSFISQEGVAKYVVAIVCLTILLVPVAIIWLG